MGSTITLDKLPTAVEAIMEDFNASVIRVVDQAGENAIKRLAQLTQATAPVSFGRHSPGRPRFASAIRWRKEPETVVGQSVFSWYVQRPNHRLTHLLENPHAARNGSTVAGRHFVRNALDIVADQYIADIEHGLD